LWLAAAALALLFVLLLALFEALQADVASLRAAIVQVQASRIAPVSEEEIGALRASASESVAIEELLNATLVRASRGGVPWLAVLQRVVPTPPSEIQLTELTQHQDRLVIRGTAAGDPALAAYVGRLRGTLLFSDVELESATVNFVISLRLKEYEP